MNTKIKQQLIDNGFIVKVRQNNKKVYSIYLDEDRYIGYLDTTGNEMTYNGVPHIEVFNGDDTERFSDYKSFKEWFDKSSKEFYENWNH